MVITSKIQIIVPSTPDELNIKPYFWNVNRDEFYMQRCLALAEKGLGTTYPNPLVGAVIVYEDKIIGEGWHFKAGAAHAEVNAIHAVKDQNLLKKSTLYVNLEPCSHHGKTPPCADLILKMQVPRVVVGSLDPNPKVAGKGIARLRESGCEVIVGVLESAAEALNRRFFTFHRKRRPFVILKWAQDQNGLMAPAERDEQAPVWITEEPAHQWVHKLRAQEAAILVGTQTVMDDNPSLTTRLWKGNNPKRLVLDRNLRIKADARIFEGEDEVVVFTEKEGLQPKVTYQRIDFDKPITKQIMDVLYEESIQSVIVEGGARTLQTFIDEQLWDEAYVFTGQAEFKEGLKGPELNGRPQQHYYIGKDLLSVYKNESL